MMMMMMMMRSRHANPKTKDETVACSQEFAMGTTRGSGDGSRECIACMLTHSHSLCLKW